MKIEPSEDSRSSVVCEFTDEEVQILVQFAVNRIIEDFLRNLPEAENQFPQDHNTDEILGPDQDIDRD